MALLLVTGLALETFFSFHVLYIHANSVKFTCNIWISRLKFKHLNLERLTLRMKLTVMLENEVPSLNHGF